ncbi:response regulator [Parachryseolinea silvisoli]|jgi:two-component system chemotaxis response regulator CheY|uniref:response regulator n=1 Tax=Parachryseolinea silvisoli TaxID=2873601 RepID=UPI002265A6B1|nr:response regulator [Parachryseolinea silvisoli]MCD9017785.1 response regulator [Parachryseolinea silvisoli]
MKHTILVVDDFASIRDFVCETLQRKGYQTVGAANGNEAYKVLTETEDVKLVLTDYNMPDCTGFELLKKIKDNPTVSKVPVIFLTTESNPDKMRSAKEAGLTAWIKKPYRSETFFAQIENALSNGL